MASSNDILICAHETNLVYGPAALPCTSRTSLIFPYLCVPWCLTCVHKRANAHHHALYTHRQSTTYDSRTALAHLQVDCVVTAWTDWGTCSEPCGGGTQTRARTITTPPSGGGLPCPNDLSENQPCNEQACPVSACCRHCILYSNILSGMACSH